MTGASPAVEPDLLQIEQLIDPSDRQVRDNVRRFVEREVTPLVAQHYRDGTFPRQLVGRLGELGLLGPTMGEHGGAGVSETAYGLIMQELERADSGLRSFCSVQSALVIYPIAQFGSPEQRAQWLPKLIRGEAIGCFGLTEPDFGSNPAAMRTRARSVGGDFVLDGCKMWITNGSIADVAVVFARRDDDRIHGFLVERDTPGLTVRDVKGKLSMRASITSELVFEGCRIPASNMLPEAKGLRAALSCLSQARYGIAFGAIGAAQACFAEALRYCGDRVQFGERPISSHQLVQHALVEMYSRIVQGQLLALHLARLKEQGSLDPVAISLAKRNNVDAARFVARAARDLLGANGIVDEYCVMRHMCNLETVHTYEGTFNIHTLIVGQALTGESAFC